MSYAENNSFSKPVEIGIEYVVDITDTGRDGEGVTRIGGPNNICEKWKSRIQKRKDQDYGS
jgi:hypothetical protein